MILFAKELYSPYGSKTRRLFLAPGDHWADAALDKNRGWIIARVSPEGDPDLVGKPVNLYNVAQDAVLGEWDVVGWRAIGVKPSNPLPKAPRGPVRIMCGPEVVKEIRRVEDGWEFSPGVVLTVEEANTCLAAYGFTWEFTDKPVKAVRKPQIGRKPMRRVFIAPQGSDPANKALWAPAGVVRGDIQPEAGVYNMGGVAWKVL